MSNVLLNSLYKYYDEKNVKKLLEVLEEDTKVSLRIIDWFVTNYSKKYNVFYTIHKTETGKNTFNDDGNRVYDYEGMADEFEQELADCINKRKSKKQTKRKKDTQQEHQALVDESQELEEEMPNHSDHISSWA